MQSLLDALHSDALNELTSIRQLSDLDSLKTLYLGKKGKLTDILQGLGKVSAEERPRLGQIANTIKTDLLTRLEQKRDELQKQEWAVQLQKEAIDTSLPAHRLAIGKHHPINQTIDDVVDIFTRLGFSVETGPDIESDYYNFEALNIPSDHPARDMHDTFYLNTGYLLRTHTSPVQIRTMEVQQPPVKIIVPGKVYRCDADVSHSPVFHQVEGLYVSKNVTFSQLKGTLEHFLRALFGPEKSVRFRPSYFPFTEPSTEVDVACVNCGGNGCNVCKHTGWLEILGAGLVNRNVLKAVNLDPDVYTGFAFGMGIERIAMLRYGISDIRLFYENDYRFLKQF